MNDSDLIRLRHMLDMAKTARTFMTNETRTTLEHDAKLQLAVVKALEIIGEAAGKVSAETRAQTPQVPWSAIIGMRNILVHAYDAIDLDEVWRTIQNDLDPLIAALEIALSSEPPMENT